MLWQEFAQKHSWGIELISTLIWIHSEMWLQISDVIKKNSLNDKAGFSLVLFIDPTTPRILNVILSATF